MTPTTALATINPAAVPIAVQAFGEERLAILKEQIGRGWKEPMTDAELEHIGLVCQRTRLDPLAKPPQIYFIKRWDSSANKLVMTPQVSIDGLRLIAQRSRAYGGQVGPQWCAADGAWRDVWLEETAPAAARVGALRIGWREPVWAVATWREWAQWQNTEGGKKKLAQFWADKPAHMLAKVAEAMALKRAFPEETNELELAAIEEEARAQQAQLSGRYEQIFGSEENGTLYDQPKTLNASGQTVDTSTGEILDEPVDEWARNRALCNRAAELGLRPIPTLNSRTPLGGVKAANDDLEGQIRAFEAGSAHGQQEAF